MRPAVWMYIEKFGKEVLIEEDHPLAVAQLALDKAKADAPPPPPPPAPPESVVTAPPATLCECSHPVHAGRCSGLVQVAPGARGVKQCPCKKKSRR
jgi:hypothetical protein